jgi:hypothetical protein
MKDEDLVGSLVCVSDRSRRKYRNNAICDLAGACSENQYFAKENVFCAAFLETWKCDIARHEVVPGVRAPGNVPDPFLISQGCSAKQRDYKGGVFL